MLKEISPGISLEGMMLKLKLQYLGEPNVLPDGMSINLYETGDLEVAGNWTSSNEFVATVDKKGKVTTLITEIQKRHERIL